LAQTTAALSEQPILAVNCKVSEPQQVQTSIEQITAHFGCVDVMVNNDAASLING
jgi:NAD(P)-dependent dehydrogenase (short-subunit alcohol dehydrogenase family)